MEETKKNLSELYQKGEIYEFIVKSVFSNYCELIDENTGIKTYLQHTAKLKLFKGQTVKCRIKGTDEKHPLIGLMDISQYKQQKDDLSIEKLSSFFTSKNVSWDYKEFVNLMLNEDKELPLESQCRAWIKNLIDENIDLCIVRNDCIELLELSDLLISCRDAEREYYQKKLTTIIEQLSYNIRAAELINNDSLGETEDTSEHFISTLFEKLSRSGFVYHPNKHFNILSSLFLRRPDLINIRIKELLDIIRGKDLQIWKKEPFKSALINLLEVYVRECDGKIDKTKDNMSLIDNNILALTIQLQLMKDGKVTTTADYRLNAARLCTIASYKILRNRERLIDVAYHFLLNSEEKIIPCTLHDEDRMPHILMNMYGGCGKIDTVNTFMRNPAKLRISGDGIQLYPLQAETTPFPVFPKSLGLWNELQVFLNSKPETNLTNIKPNDISPYQAIWKEIENEYFNYQPKKPVTKKPVKQYHREGETVNIRITRQDPEKRDKFYCKIDDEIGGEGYIFISDIVPYTVDCTIQDFLDNKGNNLLFEAKIMNEVENGFFHFTMLKIIKDLVADYYDFNATIICSIGNTPNKLYGMSPAVSSEGASVSVTNAGNWDVQRGTIVRCKKTGTAIGTFHINCEIDEIIADEFNLGEAFHTLMLNVALEESTDEVEEKEIMQTDRLLDESYVREVICMIDRMAMIDPEYVRSYNYLGFARMLCLIIGWQQQAAYYKGRMDIIAMLHFFAKNSRIDREQLDQLKDANSDLFSSNDNLHDRFMQLQTVSYMGSPERIGDLYQIACDHKGQKELALLTIAYNVVKSNRMESTANDIQNKIMQNLNLKGFETGLKQYGNGEESSTVEYKTSIVFTADQGRNPDKQMGEILKVINSFINTNGGTLYIGVNDQGMGIGIENDLNDTKYNNDKDDYKRSITDAVALKWGNPALVNCISSIEYDHENKDKDVLVIKIKPSTNGLPIDGTWYVRVDSTKRGLTQEEFKEFNKTRQLPEEIAVNVTSTGTETEAKVTPTPGKPQVKQKKFEIKTSRIRKNITKPYLDDYTEPVALFKFPDKNKFRKIPDYDYDESSPLTLTVLHDEQDAYLILGYANGHISKVPVDELLQYQDNRDYTRYSGSDLLFASIAKKDDAILSISKEDKTYGKVVMRVDDVSEFEEGRLSDDGKLPYEEGLSCQTIAFDIIPAEHKADFIKILNMKKTTLGSPNTWNPKVMDIMINKLHSWGITEI